MIRHAGLLALRLDGRWAGALIEGPSGVGKSDLAIRALEIGFRLAADDRTLVWASGGRLYGRAPGPLAGLIEVRGQGVMAEPPLAFAEIVLLARCVPDSETIARMPDPEAEIIEQLAVPRLALRATELSAPAKLRRAIEYLGAAVQQAYQATSLGGQGRAGAGETR